MSVFVKAMMELEKQEINTNTSIKGGLWLIGSLLIILVVYGLPVYGAFLIATFFEPIVETYFILQVEEWFLQAPMIIAEIVVGPFGLLTLGMYSFVWAFPVVVFISISIGITTNMGLKDKLTVAVDPLLRKIGLTGRDMIPIVTGYGCNVVAVYQSKGCSSCTRKQCLSMISFSSACSYQVGATLSLFSVAGKPWLFFPYIIILAVMGIIHTKLWYPQQQHESYFPMKDQSLRWGNPVVILANVRDAIKQFFYQAMPIFLVICMTAATLHHFKILNVLSNKVGPVLAFFSLPAEASLGILFSILRKDGILLFNERNGQLLLDLTSMELFILIYLASTLSACLVTLFAIAKDVSKSIAFQIASKQAVTSVVSSLLLVIVWRIFVGNY
ncbi:nucleoside recognition domain-containing protein [Halalkalibacter alkalisediminis]|uniref:Nucleoside recognition domain-containing protein n=1 Tax=Halalkalibacter alkalisediminis TaxID=935616 RepID=A0ABV6NDU7_9BACI|nr:nucleoside recognition domain-containing protein [Halalkalibacter alkalisediminis]